MMQKDRSKQVIKLETLDWVRELLMQNKTSVFYLKQLPDFLSRPEWCVALVELIVSKEAHPVPQYASHLLLHIARTNSNLLIMCYNAIIDEVLNTTHESVLRNLLGVLLCFPIAPYKEGELLEKLFSILSLPETKPGIVNYSCRKLNQYLILYPELGPEYELILRFREEMGVNMGRIIQRKQPCR
jgi:hypothetical protein